MQSQPAAGTDLSGLRCRCACCDRRQVVDPRLSLLVPEVGIMTVLPPGTVEAVQERMAVTGACFRQVPEKYLREGHDSGDDDDDDDDELDGGHILNEGLGDSPRMNRRDVWGLCNQASLLHTGQRPLDAWPQGPPSTWDTRCWADTVCVFGMTASSPQRNPLGPLSCPLENPWKTLTPSREASVSSSSHDLPSGTVCSVTSQLPLKSGAPSLSLVRRQIFILRLFSHCPPLPPPHLLSPRRPAAPLDPPIPSAQPLFHLRPQFLLGFAVTSLTLRPGHVTLGSSGRLSWSRGRLAEQGAPSTPGSLLSKAVVSAAPSALERAMGSRQGAA